MARADPTAGRRRPLSPILVAAGLAALASAKQRPLAEILQLLHQVPGRMPRRGSKSTNEQRRIWREQKREQRVQEALERVHCTGRVARWAVDVAVEVGLLGEWDAEDKAHIGAVVALVFEGWAAEARGEVSAQDAHPGGSRLSSSEIGGQT